MYTNIKLGMIRDYKFLYHKSFYVKKNGHVKRVNLWICIYQRNTTRPCKHHLIHCYQDVIQQHSHSSLYFCILITWKYACVECMHRQYGMCQHRVYFQKHYWIPSVNDQLQSLSSKLQLYFYCRVSWTFLHTTWGVVISAHSHCSLLIQQWTSLLFS